MQDRPVSFEEFASPRIAIIGSRSLAKYSTHILARGFAESGWDVVPLENAEYAVVQLHGAPHSATDDRHVMAMNFTALRAVNVLVHRPDEIFLHCPETKDFLNSLRERDSVVHLGDMHVRDYGFSELGRPVSVIPHGFYSISRPNRQQVLVVGTHTAWGEMRSVEHAVQLIAALFSRIEPGSFAGYLGGVPTDRLDIGEVEHLVRGICGTSDIAVVPDYGQVQRPTERHVLVVHPGSDRPADLTPLFNVQIYRHGERVRTGESSGSLHEFPNIPVIAEMNGAERVENLRVIKIPYSDARKISSLDYASAADQIADAIRAKQWKEMLRHNLKRARELAPIRIASMHRELLVKGRTAT